MTRKSNTPPTPYVDWYPAAPKLVPSGRWGDHFNRITLTPTGALAIWTSSFVGAGTLSMNVGTIANMHDAILQTGAVIGDDAKLRSTEFGIARNVENIQSVRVGWRIQLGATATTEFFCGLCEGSISNLPTSGLNFIGFVYDASDNANWKIQCADSLALSTTTTSTAATTNTVLLEFLWTSGNIEFFIAGTSVGSLTANIPADGYGMQLIIFVQTEAAAAKSVVFDKVLVEFARVI